MKKTTLAMLIASITASSALVANSSTNGYVFDRTSTKGLFKPLDLTSQFEEHNALQLGSGSLTFRVKVGSSKVNSIFAATNTNSPLDFLSFYSMRSGGNDIFGVELKQNDHPLVYNQVGNKKNPISTSLPTSDEFRTITYTFDKDNSEINIYIDGEKRVSHTSSKFFEDINTLNSVYLGEANRPNRYNGKNYDRWRFSGDIYHADLDKKVLTAEQVSEKHRQLAEKHVFDLSKREPLGAVKSNPQDIFLPGQEGAASYRIPSLLTTKDGVVIAAIDKRNQHHGDYGNIDTAIRRSLDGGKTWKSDQVILDLAKQPYDIDRHWGNLRNSSFLIDPLMVQDKNSGRVFMLLDMFPEMAGFFGINNLTGSGSGYKNIDGKYYRTLTDANNNQYTVRENGIVYNEDHQPTEYRVIVDGDKSRAYQDLGDLYENDRRVGNIFLNSQHANHDSAPLSAVKTSYLWLIHSDDNGETWSNPVDITPQVKADWMKFLGVGPGTGIQLKNGNLVMPVYYTNGKNGSQSAAVIISKDGGVTWERGESPTDRWEFTRGGSRELSDESKETTESQVIELENGDLKMFSRNKMNDYVVISTSKDGGYTWKNSYEVDQILLEPYSQLSVIKYSKKINGKEIVLFANPHSPAGKDRNGKKRHGVRANGTVWLGEVQQDGSIEWKYKTNITTGLYAYNSLTELPNGDIGLLYEDDGVQDKHKIRFVSLNLQELVWHDNLIYRDSRDNDPDRKNVSLNSPYPETFYKIGDGEMVKIGEGANLAHLVVQEGTAALNQTANTAGEKQAYASVLVEKPGKVRLGDLEQVPLNKLYLNNGTLDVNGNSLAITNPDQLRNADSSANNETIYGNIVNENAATPATLTYTLPETKTIVGNLGNELGQLNLTYQPTADNSNLRINGNTILNVIDVKSGTVSYLPNTTHKANNLILADNSVFAFGSNTTTTIKQSTLGTNSSLLAHVEADQTSKLTVNTTGSGNLVKTGDGLLQLTGDFTHSGKTVFAEGKTEFNGIQQNGLLEVHSDTTLGGNADVRGQAIWKANSRIEPGLNQNNADFAARIMKFAEVVNEGTQVLLRVNNVNDEAQSWQHDQLLISGDLHSQNAIPVDVQFLGDITQAITDTNKNGKYDVDEGISLIQVAGESEVGKFTLANKLDAQKRVHDLYQYELVSVEKEISHVADSQFNGAKFYDYRLQGLLVDEQGRNPEPVIRSINRSGSSTSVETTTFPNDELLRLLAEQRDIAAEKARKVAQALKQQQTQYRVALNEKVPSYLVANTALLNQGETIRKQFIDNLWSDEKKGFYVNQQHGNSEYRSNLKFTEYGYGYKAKQNNTSLGGFVPVGEHSEVHAAINFGKQTVTPKAADGASQTQYKSTSFLVGLHNKWDNILLNTVLGYHNHRGNVSTATHKNVARIEAKQWQLATEAGYETPVGSLKLTPVIGLSYQQLKTNINDRLSDWHIDSKPNNIFSQHLGTHMSWKNDWVRLNAGVLYEHNNAPSKAVGVKARQQNATFNTGRLGNALVLKLNSDVSLAKQLSLGLRLEHKLPLSDAKLKQTELGGKLEYRF